MQILALETSGDACSAALLRGDDVDVREEHIPRGHTERALPTVQSLLTSANVSLSRLDLIAFGHGPGSFTGVRIATSLAQGLGLASGVPLIGVSTLAALAAGVRRTFGWTQVIACLDARMREVYLGAYRCGEPAEGCQLDGGEQVGSPAQVALPGGGRWCLAGSGCAAHGETLAARLCDRLAHSAPDAHAHAQDVALLARAAIAAGRTPVAAGEATPVYLRDRVAAPAKSR